MNKMFYFSVFISQDGRGRYEGQTSAYRDPNYQYREPQPERPSSRASQYSDRPSSRYIMEDSAGLVLSVVCVNTESVVLLSHRQGYAEDYHRANRSAYDEYYANYSKNYDYRGMSLIVGRFSALSLFTR